MRYLLYIKSHCEGSDIETECEAKSKRQASKIFASMINKPYYEDGYSSEDLMEYIASDAEIARWNKRGYGKRK